MGRISAELEILIKYAHAYNFKKVLDRLQVSPSWMSIFYRIANAWDVIKEADNDTQAISAFIDLYNDFLNRGYYMYICNEIKTQISKYSNKLSLSDLDKQLLSTFVNAPKNLLQSSGLFDKGKVLNHVQTDALKKESPRALVR